MAKKKPNTGGVPATFKEFVTKYPALGLAHEGIAKAVDSVDPIDARTLALIKVGIKLVGVSSVALCEDSANGMRLCRSHGEDKDLLLR